MDRNHVFSMALAAATLGLTACGGGNDAATTTTATMTTTDGTTTVVVTPAGVVCTAPDLVLDGDLFRTNPNAPTSTFPGYGYSYVGPCVPASSGGGASRYNVKTRGTGCGFQVERVDFGNASCTGSGTRVAEIQPYSVSYGGTTTVASLGTDNTTQVSGVGQLVTINTTNSVSGTGTFPASVPLTTTGTFVLCKTTASTTTTLSGSSLFTEAYSFTPTFSLKVSNVGGTAINTTVGFDGKHTPTGF